LTYYLASILSTMVEAVAQDKPKDYGRKNKILLQFSARNKTNKFIGCIWPLAMSHDSLIEMLKIIYMRL
jgi:hypothetical protein